MLTTYKYEDIDPIDRLEPSAEILGVVSYEAMKTNSDVGNAIEDFLKGWKHAICEWYYNSAVAVRPKTSPYNCGISAGVQAIVKHWEKTEDAEHVEYLKSRAILGIEHV